MWYLREQGGDRHLNVREGAVAPRSCVTWLRHDRYSVELNCLAEIPAGECRVSTSAGHIRWTSRAHGEGVHLGELFLGWSRLFDEGPHEAER